MENNYIYEDIENIIKNNFRFNIINKCGLNSVNINDNFTFIYSNNNYILRDKKNKTCQYFLHNLSYNDDSNDKIEDFLTEKELDLEGYNLIRIYLAIDIKRKINQIINWGECDYLISISKEINEVLFNNLKTIISKNKNLSLKYFMNGNIVY